MNCVGIFDNRLPADILEAENIEGILCSILDTLECMQNNRTATVYTDILYEQVVSKKVFSNWLYDLNNQPELSTLKKELAKRIAKSMCIGNKEYDSLIDQIEQQACQEELAMSVHLGGENPLYVSTPSRYWNAKQWYLARYVKRHDFVSAAAECFPNLYFHNHVSSSINTLNADFSQERVLIVEHLKALNDFKAEFSRLRDEGSDSRKICSEFQAFFHIECSPQSDRKSAEKLDYKFINENTGEEIVVRCELHSKLKWNGMDRENQDRIYFHPGRPEIENGKVLIVHIGTHQ